MVRRSALRDKYNDASRSNDGPVHRIVPTFRRPATASSGRILTCDEINGSPPQMSDLRTLWDISDESFRALLETHLGRRYALLPGEEVSPSELAAPMPGDELIPSPDRMEMRATNIDVPVHDAWPWLAQMMRGAGIYGWPRLESTACSSADMIICDIPPPRVGDRVGDLFELAAIDPPQTIVWRSCQHISVLGLTMRELSLSYRLTPITPARSRLLARQRCLLDQKADRLARRFSNLVHFLLPCSQLRCIKYHAEATAAMGTAKTTPVNGSPHQAAPFHAAADRSPR